MFILVCNMNGCIRYKYKIILYDVIIVINNNIYNIEVCPISIIPINDLFDLYKYQ